MEPLACRMGKERTVSPAVSRKDCALCPASREGPWSRRDGSLGARPPPGQGRAAATRRSPLAARRARSSHPAPVHRPRGVQAVAVRSASGLAGHLTLNEEEHAVTDDSLSSHVHEMDFAPDPAFAAQANGTGGPVRRRGRGPRGVLGRAGAQRHHAGRRTSTRPSTGAARRSRSGSSAASSTSAYNCVDRHVEAGNGDRVAIHFEGEAGDTRTITYADLQREVAKAANALSSRLGSPRVTGWPSTCR